jgi:hypothetical protein
MRSFHITNNTLFIYMTNGATLVIFLNENSGKVYYRFKIDTVSQVKHTGIYLGTDMNGVHYMMHNHYENSRPCIVTLDGFRKGKDFYEYTINPLNSSLEVIEIGLKEVLRGERYDSVNYNCQTFVNIACINKRKSDDVDKWIGRVVVGSLLFFGIAAIAGGKR